jgi:putative ABC transport system ATP-binding protein
MLELFSSLRESLNLTLVVVTHDKVVASHADRVLHLVDGEFTQQEALHG